MRKSSPQGLPPKPVAFSSSLGSSLVRVSYPIPVGGGTTLQCDTWVQAFLPWHNTAAAVINITWCGPYHLGSNGLFWTPLSWPIDLGWCVSTFWWSLPTRLNSLFGTLHCLCEVFTVSDQGIWSNVHISISKINHTWHLHWASSNNLMRAQSTDLLGDALILHSTAGQCSTHGYSFRMHFGLAWFLIVLFDRSTCPDACAYRDSEGST